MKKVFVALALFVAVLFIAGCAGQATKAVVAKDAQSARIEPEQVRPDVIDTGAAVKKNTTNSTNVSASCTDSDGGLNYYTYGWVSGYMAGNGSPYTFYDSCSGNNVNEWYCSGSAAAIDHYTCPFGCSNGTCVNQSNQPPSLTYYYVQYQYTNTTYATSNVTWSASDANGNMAYVELKSYRNGVIQSTSTFPCTGSSCSGSTLVTRNQTGYYVYNATAVDAASARSAILSRWLFYVP
ncbi:MAG: hypothetical protein V1725_01170 [archaeon]